MSWKSLAIFLAALGGIGFLVAILLSPPWTENTARRRPLLADPLVVEATGSEFEWYFRGPGDDGELGTADDVDLGQALHLPVGASVEIRLTSNDYIYTMSTPDLTQREIAVPDLTHRLSFRATQEGTYELLSDPLCGLRFFHDEVMGRVIIEPEADYWEWMEDIQ